MKYLRNILAIIAILTQIIMGQGLSVHAPDCHVTQANSHANKAHKKAHQHCSCHQHEHDHHSHELNSDSEPLTPPHDCTCSQLPDSSYILSHQLILSKIKFLPTRNEANSTSDIASSIPSLSRLFHITHPSNAPPPDRHHSHLHIAQLSCHFTSVYLGVFLI